MSFPRHSKYKPSGVEWLGEVPADWAVKRFKHHIDYQEGPGIMADDFMEKGVPLLRIHNVQGSFVNLQDCNYLDPQKARNRWNHFKLKRGNLLISCSASTGTLSEVTDESEGSIAYTGIIRIGPSDKTITKDFIKWIVSSEVFFTQIELLKTGTTIQHFGPAHLGKMFIPLPKINEQHSIANFLDNKTAQIDALIEKKQSLIDLLKEKRTTLISHAVTKGLDPNVKMKDSGVEWLGEVPAGWDVRRLKHIICEPLKYGANEAAELNDPALPRYIRITDVNEQGKLREETFKSIPEEIAQPYLLKEGDLLFARSGATVGKNFCYESSWGQAAYAGYLIRARCNPQKTLPRFLNYFASSHNYWQWLSSVFIQATIQNVSAEKYGNLIIALPSFNEQLKITAYLDNKTAQIDALIEKVQIAIDKLKEYRTALISAAVTGKIDVRGFDSREVTCQ